MGTAQNEEKDTNPGIRADQTTTPNIFQHNLKAQKSTGPVKFRHAIDDPLSNQQSEVYDIYSNYAITGNNLHPVSVKQMIDKGLYQLTGITDPNEAWHEFVHDQDIIAIKFTDNGSRELGVNTQFAEILLESLYTAGYKPENIMLIGLENLPKNAKNTRKVTYGWQKTKVDFGSDSDYLALWLKDATAIINVPTIMDDNVIGLRGAMANLAWPVIKSPAKYYKYMRTELNNQGDPFIPDIYALPQIRGKVRLHIANALRVLYNGGPLVKNQTYVHNEEVLIFSTDPVALDRRALELINQLRKEQDIMPKGENPDIKAPYLDTAEAMGLGYADQNYIFYRKINAAK
ncbi:MAG: DUF362 domain-containing protein [Phycisphaerae bacterium]|nr:DUF362 domain-containing protein [Phycisphaerae bacterium]